jgi:hypothetical protein
MGISPSLVRQAITNTDAASSIVDAIAVKLSRCGQPTSIRTGNIALANVRFYRISECLICLANDLTDGWLKRVPEQTNEAMHIGYVRVIAEFNVWCAASCSRMVRAEAAGV